MDSRFLFLPGLVGLLFLAVLAGCRTSEPTATPPSEPKPPAEETATFALRPLSFRALAGWSQAPMAPSLQAFQRSCTQLLERPSDAPMVSGRPAFGTVRDWQPACFRARSLGDTTEAAARQFFRRFFRPFRMAMGADTEGLFTGYFEPQLQGSRTRTGRFTEPLHRRPSDLVEVPLGRFFSDPPTDRLFGHVQDGRLVPYHTRAEISNGKLRGSDLALVWVDSRVDKFFLQIQGSGRVVLRDGSVMRVGYAAENGHAYRAIGRDLIAMGAVPREEMSMQAIRQWLATHPRRADALMNKNPSYVFFRSLDHLDASLGPIGAQGVPLTPEVSMAVDPRFVPYGAPLYLVTRRPATSGNSLPSGAARQPAADTSTVPFRRLMIAQDTGGAIRGAVRGDVFWGAGERARLIAGRMKAQGRYTVLLPRTL